MEGLFVGRFKDLTTFNFDELGTLYGQKYHVNQLPNKMSVVSFIRWFDGRMVFRGNHYWKMKMQKGEVIQYESVEGILEYCQVIQFLLLQSEGSYLKVFQGKQFKIVSREPLVVTCSEEVFYGHTTSIKHKVILYPKKNIPNCYRVILWKDEEDLDPPVGEVIGQVFKP